MKEEKQEKREHPPANAEMPEQSFRSIQALLDSYPEAVFLMECSGKIVEANKNFALWMGKSLQECIGRNVYDMLPPEHAAKRRQQGEEVVRTGKQLSFEDERNNRTLLHTVYPSCSPDGKIDHLLIIAEDITDIQQTRLSLQSEQAFNNALIEATPGTFCLIDADGRLAAWNPYLRDEIVGKPESEMPGVEALMLIHPDDRPLIDEKMQNVFIHGMEESAEARVLLRGGPAFRWLVFKAKRVIIKSKLMMIGIGTDITERKQAEAAREESEMHYRDLFTNMTSGFAYCRLVYDGEKAVDFVCEQVNRQTERLTGQIPVVGRRVSDILPGIHQANPEALERYARVATTGLPDRFEFYLKERNIWFDLSVYSPKKGYFAVVFDVITARKRSEAALQKSEQRFRTITEHISEMVFVTAESGVFTYVSPAVKRLLGYTPEEVIGRRFQEFLPEEDIVKSVDAFTAITTNHSMSHISELRFQRKNSTTFWGEVHMQWYQEHRESGAIGILLDCNERKRIETMRSVRVHLLETAECCSIEKLLQVTLDEAKRLTESPLALFHGVSDDQLSSSLQASSTQSTEREWLQAQQAGFEPLESGGILAEVVKEQRAVIENSSSRSIRPERERTLVVPIKRGSLVVAALELANKQSPYHSEDAQLIGVLGDIVWDILTRKRSEEDREKLQQQLLQSQKMELVGQLAGGIAHDFNNMLSVILGHAEIALQKGEFSHDDLEAIHEASIRSAALTHQLLAFARKQSVTPKVVDLNVIIEGVLSMLRRLIGENITLGWVAETHHAWVKIDPSQVDQILANLCVNARDAIAGTGNIMIKTAIVHLESITGTTTNPADYVMLSVTDNGSGIDNKDLPSIFEPFFTTKEAGKGTGMGLSTVYGIVKQNHGTINCESETGKGSCFRIYLPLHQEHPSEQAVVAQKPESVDGQATILLVEDDAAILKLCKIMLETKKYKVIAAPTPLEAIAMAEQFPGDIDLLLTDIIMPEMNGRDLSKTLHAAYPKLKTLFMSGYTANIIANEGGVAEDVHLIEKPFSITSLINSVQKVLQTGSALQN